MIRKAIAWLSSRFPPQRVVSLVDYNALKDGLITVDRTVAELNVRLVSIDAQVKRLNDQAGYVSIKKGSFALER